MSTHGFVVEWLPPICHGFAASNLFLGLHAYIDADKPRICRYALRIAAVEFVGGVDLVGEGKWGLALGNGGSVALYLLVWWNNGGGDGTKRRRKKLKEKFVGTRRTAPVMA